MHGRNKPANKWKMILNFVTTLNKKEKERKRKGKYQNLFEILEVTINYLLICF